MTLQSQDLFEEINRRLLFLQGSVKFYHVIWLSLVKQNAYLSHGKGRPLVSNIYTYEDTSELCEICFFKVFHTNKPVELIVSF